MKKFALVFLPFLLAGFVLPEDNCRQNTIIHNDPAIGDQVDGPYVFYTGEKMIINYILDSNNVKWVKRDTVSLSEKQNIALNVVTDEPGKSFKVRLQKNLENDRSEFDNVNKRFVVSDIEGNFAALRKLLQGNGVIDSAYNWTFGDGHLILTGDFVDRGMQQTEVLWLIYSLEEKAKAAGGYVHFILGNHEIMDLSGDLRYLHPKYTETAVLLNRSYPALIGDSKSELGRWLRSKNVVEKVGNILFCHGGFSAAVNFMDYNISKINKLVRSYYGDSTYKYRTNEIEILYSDLGPFWYRGYYSGTTAYESQIDSTLRQYKVDHIATGHTIVADTISVLFRNKVINTDVHHLKGHTEALLIEGENYYRVNPAGERFPIMKN